MTSFFYIYRVSTSIVSHLISLNSLLLHLSKASNIFIFSIIFILRFNYIAIGFLSIVVTTQIPIYSTSIHHLVARPPHSPLCSRTFITYSFLFAKLKVLAPPSYFSLHFFMICLNWAQNHKHQAWAIAPLGGMVSILKDIEHTDLSMLNDVSWETIGQK